MALYEYHYKFITDVICVVLHSSMCCELLS